MIISIIIKNFSSLFVIKDRIVARIKWNKQDLFDLYINRRNFHVLASKKMIAKIIDCDSNGIVESASIIQNGGLVAFPTETVYGLGADAFNEVAVKKVFMAKKRPSSDPLIVHVISKQMLIARLFDFSSCTLYPDGQRLKNVSSCQIVSETLCDFFWPGPLTIVFKAKSEVPSAVTAGSGFVGVRSPLHPVARALLSPPPPPFPPSPLGLAIAAPSANRFGHVSPTSSEHVLADLGGEEVAVLLDEPGQTGGCRVGIESTVCKLAEKGPLVEVRILRCGAVTSADIERALASVGSVKCEVVVDNGKTFLHTSNPSQSTISDEVALSPGQMVKHYSPDLPTFIVSTKPISRKESNVDKKYFLKSAVVIDFGNRLSYLRSSCLSYSDLSISGEPKEACTGVFAALRATESNELGATHVLLPDLSIIADKDEMVKALWERLHRAASGEFIDAELDSAE
jgi:tRNA threonylcarbamoyl adenosine modification protein (Sua5/YciO/YrdC/YwlC family)